MTPSMSNLCGIDQDQFIGLAVQDSEKFAALCERFTLFFVESGIFPDRPQVINTSEYLSPIELLQRFRNSGGRFIAVYIQSEVVPQPLVLVTGKMKRVTRSLILDNVVCYPAQGVALDDELQLWLASELSRLVASGTTDTIH